MDFFFSFSVVSALFGLNPFSFVVGAMCFHELVLKKVYFTQGDKELIIESKHLNRSDTCLLVTEMDD